MAKSNLMERLSSNLMLIAILNLIKTYTWCINKLYHRTLNPIVVYSKTTVNAGSMPKLRHRNIDPKVVYSKTIIDINSIFRPIFHSWQNVCTASCISF